MNPRSRIVAAIDFSSISARVAAEGAHLARALSADLTLVHVASPLNDSDANEALIAKRTQELESLARTLRDPSLRVVCHVELGDAAEEIARDAEIDRAELLVIGTHGRKGIGRFLMGSVADELTHQAPCPVLVVREPVATLRDARSRRLQ